MLSIHFDKTDDAAERLCSNYWSLAYDHMPCFADNNQENLKNVRNLWQTSVMPQDIEQPVFRLN